MDELKTVADVLRHGADLVEADWWNGQQKRSETSHCALTSVDVTTQNVEAFESYDKRVQVNALAHDTRLYLQHRVAELGYDHPDPQCPGKAYVAVWNDDQDNGEIVAKHMRMWADQWEDEHPGKV